VIIRIYDIRYSFWGKAMDFVKGAGKPAPFFILFSLQYTPITPPLSSKLTIKLYSTSIGCFCAYDFATI